ncbi:hypothetical protein PsorP6_013107 [Peronosclerospora sorghi]|uniref:Uncharacterized protein n=1 Tax=Peronosclerospora sorghi TaxID=230839 RepID=A0ACC0WH23_9STRA|nr:hypothetical protein PsorP6_013107 [Peronosclerospora sorghi]
MTINNVADAGDGSFFVAQLASRVFRPGGIVKGVVRLVSNQQNSHAHSEIIHVVAQVHGHVTVDSNLLTLPLLDVRLPETASNDHQKSVDHEVSRDAVLMEKINAVLPDVRKFSGDTGTCIFCSAPAVVLSDINITPSQSELQVATSECPPPADALSLGEAARKETAKRCTGEFAIALPTKMCPSFRGTSARVFYVVSITAQCASSGSKPISVHLPFDVYGSEYYFAANNTVASASQLEASKDHDSGNSMKAETSVESRAEKPVGVLCQSNQVAFELRPSLMHGRVETELLQRAQTSIFTIGKENSHLVRFLLTKQFYQPGDVLLGMFDFTRASIPCYKVSTTLCFEETLASMALDPDRVVQSKVCGSFHEHTLDVLNTNVRFSIPHDALPTITTDLVRFQWLLRFEFSAGGTPATNATVPQRQQFQWHVPVVVKPAVATARNQLANVPHKLYSGAIRVASLSTS